MSAQPTTNFEWCIDDTDSDGNILKASPPAEIIQTGLLVGQPWARVWHNEAINNFGEFNKFIATEVLAVGAVLIFADASKDMSSFVGTWAAGVQIAASGNYMYERTA